MKGNANRDNKSDILSRLYDVVETLIICVAVFLFLHFSFDKNLIMSGSMEPTLMTGDTIISTAFYSIKRGDIICFKHDGENLGKRVIGIGGDVITFSDDGMLIVNGERVEEPYLACPNSTFPFIEKQFEVPEGKFFVLGDNRLYSCDSRYWENPYVDEKDITGEYLFTLFRSKRE